MTFPATQSAVRDAFHDVRSAALHARTRTQRVRDLSAAGDTPRLLFVQLQRNLQEAINQWDAAASTPGLVQYARDQYDDQSFDIVAEYNAMRAAAVSVRDWIFTNMPTDAGSGAILAQTLAADGTLSDLTFSSAASASFRVEADALLATIS